MITILRNFYRPERINFYSEVFSSLSLSDICFILIPSAGDSVSSGAGLAVGTGSFGSGGVSGSTVAYSARPRANENRIDFKVLYHKDGMQYNMSY